jgi:hypothetical protein
MNKSHRKTLNDIFSQPVPATLEWRRIESLFVSLGAQAIEEGSIWFERHCGCIPPTTSGKRGKTISS